MNPLRPFLLSIYPPLCRGCQTLIIPEHIFCPLCSKEVKPLPTLILPVTPAYRLTVYAASSYDHPVRSLVTRKFSGDVGASRQLARLMLVSTPLRTHAIDYIVPIPLHWTRYAQRGFNQAYEMACTISKDLDKPVIRLVRRRRKTTYQWKLSGKQRTENMKNAFAMSLVYRWKGTDFIKDKHIVLVDDLCTTGATLIQVARIIATCQPASITAFVGCRAI